MAACSAEPAPSVSPPVEPIEKEPVAYTLALEDPWTTLRAIWLPTQGSSDVSAKIHAGELRIEHLERYADYGLDNLQLGDGEPHQRYVYFGAETAPVDIAQRRSLAYFAQLSDFQITDQESPVRLEGVTKFAYASAYRPQDHLSTQLVDALLQSVNAFSFADRPLDFLFITGDLADNAQENETWWVIQLMDGGVVWPDSGIIDDPIPGSGNDFTDPFLAAGLDPRVPWYVILGNHDQSHLGTFNPTPRVQAAAVGNEIIDLWNLSALSNGDMTFGVRDASRPFAPVVRSGHVHPDPQRRILTIPEIMAMYLTSPTLPAGHGFTAEATEKGIASYVAQPVEDFPLQLLAIDTNMEMIVDAQGNITQHASSAGQILRDVWEDIVLPALADAKANDQFVIIGSHHCTHDMLNSDGAIDPVDIRKTFAEYPNILGHFCGHGHRTDKWLWNEDGKAWQEGDGHGYVELMSPSGIDFPVQGRLLELVDNDNGTLSIFTTQVEPNLEPGSLAYDALTYSAATGNFPIYTIHRRDRWNEGKASRNMELVIPLPAGFETVVADLRTRSETKAFAIESLGRLGE